MSSARAYLPLAFLLLTQSALAQPQPAPTLDRDRVPSAGRSEAVVDIPVFGRFAVMVTSEEGTAVQLVDRMTGPSAFHGTPGDDDGRIDGFFDRGEYKIVTRGHPRASGEARIFVHPFVEQNGETPPRLVDHRLIESTLHDLEQRSYWIHLSETAVVILEAAGRSLADLRLWRDGRWLVDIEPTHAVSYPASGRPMGVCRIAARLPAGLYLLSAYGGPAREWSEETEETSQHAFYLRSGIPPQPAIGRAHREVSPFGIDRFLLPPGQTFVRADLPEARDLLLEVSLFDELRPFSGGARGVIDKNSVMPVAEIHGPNSMTGTIVTVTAEAGQPYVLQHFPPYGSGSRFSPPQGAEGRYWLSTVHSGTPADYSDASAVLGRHWTRTTRRGGGVELIDYSAAHLGPDQPWARRFDLQGTTTIHIDVKAAGSYRFQSDPPARFRIEPMMTSRPPRYVTPDYLPSGEGWNLDRGVHVLTVDPSTRGVVEMSLSSTKPVSGASWFQRLLRSAEPDSASEWPPPLPAAQWPGIALSPSADYMLYLAARPGTRAGLVFRPLPIDPREALPVVQKPGETIAIPLRIEEVGTLRARAEDGSLLPISVGRGRPSLEPRLSVGRRTVRISHDGDDLVLYSLSLEPDSALPTAPLPTMSQALLDQRPIFPVLTPGETRYFDLGRRNQETFSVQAIAPALYRLESTGLLDTAGNLRTRTITSFELRSDGGTGRNFLVQRYLREGDYQLTVSTRGRSAGRLGLSLTPTPLTDGGLLRDGIPARAEVPAGEGLLYRFEVSEAGSYRIESLGLDRSFRARLEDSEGWPLVRPGIDGNFSHDFEPGIYRLILLPEPLETRRVVRVSRVQPAPSFSGHGPHRLPLDVSVTNLWREPEEGGERLPDVWTFSLPAPSPVLIELGAGMEGELMRGTEKVAQVAPVRGWRGALRAGDYRLEVKSLRPDDRLNYHLAVRSDHLVAGLARTIAAPHSLTVSLGESGLVELSTFGRTDVRGRLFDSAGVLVAENDDRPGDWSFLISRYLAAGDYELRVDPVGTSSGSTTIRMEVPRQIAGETIRTPSAGTLSPGDDVLVIPLETTSTGLLVLAAESKESFGVALEARLSGEGWSTLESRVGRRVRIEVPLPGSGAGERGGSPLLRGERPIQDRGSSVTQTRREARAQGRANETARYRLRLWSVDRGGNPVELAAMVASPRPISESDLERGAEMQIVSGIEPPVAVASLAASSPGALILRDDSEDSRWTDQVHIPARTSSNQTVLRSGGAAWLIRDLEAGATAAPKLRADRALLSAVERLPVTVPFGEAATIDIEATVERRRLFARRREPRGPLLVRAFTEVGQPGLVIGETGERRDRGELSTISHMPGTAVAVSLAGRPGAVSLWDAAPVLAGKSMEARVSFFENARSQPQQAESVGQGVVPAETSLSFTLPGGEKIVRLILDEVSLAVLSDGEVVSSVHGGAGIAVAETVPTTASMLTIMPAEKRDGRYAFEIIPAQESERWVVGEGVPFDRTASAAGSFRLNVAAPSAGGPAPILRARGAVESAVLLGEDGRITTGDAPIPPGGGTLLVRHGEGTVFVWADSGEAFGDGLLTAEQRERPVVRPRLPSIAGFSSRSEVLDIATGSGPAMLHLRSAAPVVASITGEGIEGRVEIYPSGMSEDLYLPRGSARVVLRALGDSSVIGAVSISSTGVLETSEGLGPIVLLGPGEARGYLFEVIRSGPVGVGVQAEGDRVQARILDPAGAAMTGPFVVGMPTLEAGRYIIVLRAAPDSSPLWARPALAGIEPPDTGPPAEVVRGYLSSGLAGD